VRLRPADYWASHWEDSDYSYQYRRRHDDEEAQVQVVAGRHYQTRNYYLA